METTNKDNVVTDENKDNIVTYENKDNIKNITKKESIKKSFLKGGISAVLTTLAANTGIVKLLVPISTYFAGHNAVNIGIQAGKLIASENVIKQIQGWLLSVCAHGTITTLSILQFIAANPMLTSAIIGTLVGLGATIISTVKKSRKEKKGTITEIQKGKTR